MTERDTPGDGSATSPRVLPPEERAPLVPTRLLGTEPALPKKAVKPPKPRKVEKRQRGRKG